MSTDPTAEALALDCAACELDHAAAVAAQPLEDLAREARALAGALRACPRGAAALEPLVADLAARLGLVAAHGGRVGARVALAVEALQVPCADAGAARLSSARSTFTDDEADAPAVAIPSARTR